jgi:rhodanese-related sulfurtransferase
MNENGIPATYALLGGTDAWKNAGMPMEKSANPTAPPANQ